MALFTSTVLSLEEDLQSITNEINSIVSAANSNTRFARDYVSSYNQAKSRYDEKLGAYEEAIEQFQSTTIAFNAHQSLKTIPSTKDKLEHYPGGTFGHYGALAGGPLYSPVFVPSMEVGKQNANSYTNLLNGNIVNFLHKGIGELNSLVNLGIIDVDFSKSRKNTISIPIKVEIEISGKFGKTIETYTIYIEDGEGRVDMSETSFGTNMDMDELDSIMNLELTSAEQMISGLATGFTGNHLAGTMAISLYNLATGDSVRAAQTVMNASISTILGAVSQRVAQLAISSFNITSMPTVIGLMLGISALAREAFEVAVDLDNHFGLGGDFSGSFDNLDTYERSKGFIGEISDTVSEFFGNETSSTLETYSGNFLGEQNANFSEITSSTLGSFNQLVGNLESRSSEGRNIASNSFAAINEISTFGGFKDLERSLGLSGGSSDKTVTGEAWGDFDEAAAGYGIGDDGYEGNDF